MAEQLIRNEQVVSSILTTSSTGRCRPAFFYCKILFFLYSFLKKLCFNIVKEIKIWYSQNGSFPCLAEGVLIMKKHIVPVAEFIIQTVLFYAVPATAQPGDEMGMVFMLFIAAIVLSVVAGVPKSFLKIIYPVAVPLVFLPSVYIYYNESALVHGLWYFAVCSIGVITGTGFGMLVSFISNRCESE